MVSVNLVPENFQIQKQRKTRLRFWCFFAAALSLVFLVGSGYLYHGLLRIDKSVRHTFQQQQELKEEITTLQQSETELAGSQNQWILLHQLRTYPDVLSMIGFLSKHTPEMIYLEKLQFTRPENETGSLSSSENALPKSASLFHVNPPAAPSAKPATPVNVIVELEGQSLDYQAIAEYLMVLRSSGIFTQVHLKRSWRESGKETDSVRFTIECNGLI